MAHDVYNKGYLETISFKLAGILVDVAQKELFCCAQAVNPCLVHFKCNLYELNCFMVYVGIPAFDFAMTARDSKNLAHILNPELEDLAVCQHSWTDTYPAHYPREGNKTEANNACITCKIGVEEVMSSYMKNCNVQLEFEE